MASLGRPVRRTGAHPHRPFRSGARRASCPTMTRS